MPLRPCTILLATLPPLLLGACSGGKLLPDAITGTTTETDKAPAISLPNISLPSLPDGVSKTPPVGTPTEIYTRVARGALTCWLGAHGPLKGTHVFHAEAASPSKGGHSKIAIDEKRKNKDKDKEQLRGRRVFTVEIEGNPVTGAGAVTTRNLKLPKPLATRMEKDVVRWAANEEGCVQGGVTAGWEAAPKSKKGKSGKSR